MSELKKEVNVTCDKCQNAILVDDESFFGKDAICPKCESEIFIPYPESKEIQNPNKSMQNVPTSPAMKTNRNQIYGSRYEATRGISGIIEIIGWLYVVVGLGAFIYGLSMNTQWVDIIPWLPAIVISITGLFIVMGAQVTRAIVNNADQTRAILEILKNDNNRTEPYINTK